MKKFIEFLTQIANNECNQDNTNTTSSGSITIQQTLRNELRKQGVEALMADLEQLYLDEAANAGIDLDIVQTKEGIVFAVESNISDYTFSWELKNTIKSLDYDPFIEASKFADEQEEKAAKKAKRIADAAEREQELAEKRAKKLAKAGLR